MSRKDLRTGEQAGVRAGRTFKEKGNWFFETREGTLAGPFQDELEASVRLEVYIRMLNCGLHPLPETLCS